MTHKIILWNCHSYKANYNEQLLLAKLKHTAICFQETFKKAVINQIQKPFMLFRLFLSQLSLLEADI